MSDLVSAWEISTRQVPHLSSNELGPGLSTLGPIHFDLVLIEFSLPKEASWSDEVWVIEIREEF